LGTPRFGQGQQEYHLGMSSINPECLDSDPDRSVAGDVLLRQQPETELVLLHQDAFAADYQEDEYKLLGMAIKYAGLRGKEVRVIGKNRSSLAEEERIQ